MVRLFRKNNRADDDFGLWKQFFKSMNLFLIFICVAMLYVLAAIFLWFLRALLGAGVCFQIVSIVLFCWLLFQACICHSVSLFRFCVEWLVSCCFLILSNMLLDASCRIGSFCQTMVCRNALNAVVSRYSGTRSPFAWQSVMVVSLLSWNVYVHLRERERQLVFAKLFIYTFVHVEQYVPIVVRFHPCAY